MKKLLSLFGGILGLAILLAYLNFAFGWVLLSQRLGLVLAFAIGPVAIWGTLAIYESFVRVFGSFALRVGTIFLVIAFALLTLMLTMQQAVFAEYQAAYDAIIAGDDLENEWDDSAAINVLFTPAAATASRRRRLSSIDNAIGFSTSTCFPAPAAAMPWAACTWLGPVTSTMSTRSSASTAS